MSTSTYILLKDLPNINEGATFIKVGDNYSAPDKHGGLTIKSARI